MPDDERTTFLNLRTVNPGHLFEAARELNGPDEPRGPALVVAQAAVEVGVEMGVNFALQIRRAYDPLREWVMDESINSWSPTNDRVRRLWTALTGDTLTAAPSWSAYAEGIRWRHAFVHRASAVPRGEAYRFIEAAENLMQHMVDVLAETFPSWR